MYSHSWPGTLVNEAELGMVCDPLEDSSQTDFALDVASASRRQLHSPEAALLYLPHSERPFWGFPISQTILRTKFCKKSALLTYMRTDSW